MKESIFLYYSCLILVSCNLSEKNEPREEISIKEIVSNRSKEEPNSINKENINEIEVAPGEILLTGQQDHRLICFNKKDRGRSIDISMRDYFSNTNEFEFSENDHIMRSFEVHYGYNLLNVAHLNVKTKKLNNLFDKYVLIKNLYYPSYFQDSFNKKPIVRNYYMISCYDEDTNKDSIINKNDLRRIYYFDINGENKTKLLSNEYSVQSSNYDPANDIMFISAKHDKNNSGTIQKNEPNAIFMLELKNPNIVKKIL